MKTLGDLIGKKEILVCVGPGGVGKTTISATLALEGAFAGKKTLALTIDPAMRLATSLGLSNGRKRHTQIHKDRFKKAGSVPRGELHVMMLDVKTTFDELIRKASPSEAQAEKILSNRYYQSIANSLPGSQEYMAMEALLSVYEQENYDLIVIDTPPSRHALDFLSAPRRLAGILDATAIRLMLKSYFLANRLSFGFTKIWASLALKALEKIVGVDVLHDVWDFLMDFDAISEPLKRRAGETFNLLRSSKSAFLIVTAAGKPALSDSLNLYRNLISDGFEVEGVIANRVYSGMISLHEGDGVLRPDRAPSLRTAGDLPNLEREVKTLLGKDPDLAEKLVKNYESYKRVMDSEKSNLEGFEKSVKGKIPVIPVPSFDVEVYDLERLLEVREYLSMSEG